MRVSTSTRSNQGCARLRLFWRRLVGAAAIYALVMQPLLLGVIGVQLAQASALDGVALSELCLHNADGSPAAPADQERHPAHQHCLQCFAGAFVLGASQSVVIASADREFRKLRRSGLALRLPSSSQYLAARPRGPPISA
jgi:hypothetical protein